MKKEILIPVAVAMLTAAFLVVSLLVLLSNGNAGLVKKKIRLGAILLSLTMAASLGGCERTTTCYAPKPSYQESIRVTDSASLKGRVITLDLKTNNIIRGEIINRKNLEYSYLISDTSFAALESGDILPADGAIDEDYEQFNIEVNKSLTAGRYYLFLAPLPKETIAEQFNSQWNYYILDIVE